MKELQRENDLCDVTLACEERQIKTNKFVISAFSHSFLESAEDLNTRGLSEANTESLLSNR